MWRQKHRLYSYWLLTCVLVTLFVGQNSVYTATCFSVLVRVAATSCEHMSPPHRGAHVPRDVWGKLSRGAHVPRDVCAKLLAPAPRHQPPFQSVCVTVAMCMWQHVRAGNLAMRGRALQRWGKESLWRCARGNGVPAHTMGQRGLQAAKSGEVHFSYYRFGLSPSFVILSPWISALF